MRTLAGFEVDAADLESIDQIVLIGDSSGLSYWSDDDYRNEIGRPDSIFRKCCDPSGSVVGFIVGRTVPGSIEGSYLDAEIYNIAVDRRTRRQGVGAILLENLVNECINLRVMTIWLEVRLGNEAAREFYKRSGFSDVTIRRSFYADPVEDAIIMNRTL